MKGCESEAQPLIAATSNDSQRLERVVASCVGFLADSYDLFTIDLVVLILELQYGETLISTEAKSLMVSTMLAGVVAGQLTFGCVADCFGRKWAFVCTAGLTVISALASSMCFHDAQMALPLQLALCRFVLGCGVGGEYPLSATASWLVIRSLDSAYCAFMDTFADNNACQRCLLKR